jgi:hypothetical protein
MELAKTNNGRWQPRHRLDLLTTAYSYATLGEKVVSLVTKLEFCGLAFGRLDKSFCDKLIENSSFVRLQIRTRAVQ